MPLLTTCIGAYPKPEFIELPDWFNIEAGPDTADPTMLWEDAMKAMGPDALNIIDKGVAQSIDDQTGACLLYTSPSPRDQRGSRMPSSA